MTVLGDCQRIVVKTGSALVAKGDKARTEWLSRLAGDIAALRARGAEIILVSSGAVALGRRVLSDGPLTRLEQKQAAAAIGQPRLVSALQGAFDFHDMTVAQALLTLSDTETRRSWLNARATLEALLECGALPVINENDTVATDEIRYGDNDRLAARVAQMMSADTLILLTDVDGLYTADPATSPDASHVPQIDALTDEHLKMAGGIGGAGVGSGGMKTKLAAARIAYEAGCRTIITRGNRAAPLLALDDGALATIIQPPFTPATAREIWLKSHLDPKGGIIVDEGAASALANGASLLPVGATGVEGQFERGSAVAIRTAGGVVLANGVTAYSSQDVQAILGLRSDEIEQALGYRGRPALVHRDDMVLV